jgi:3-methyl-2-oxobutanoate hydroxymethyltransferase
MARVTVTTLKEMKKGSEKIAALTAYDASFARILDEEGVDVILVGDSLGMVIQGHDTTVPVSMDDMIYHAKAVAPSCKRALHMVDMPFMSYTSPQHALDNAARLMREGGAHMVKLEGGTPQIATIQKLAQHGVPVCAHLGLQPQSVHKLGGYRVQGKEQDAALQMLEDAIALQDAGADALVLECVPQALAKEITMNLEIPTIGIGAGVDCDGQVLVLPDLLGITKRAPKFSKDFMQDNGSIQNAVKSFVNDVKSESFPSQEYCLA